MYSGMAGTAMFAALAAQASAVRMRPQRASAGVHLRLGCMAYFLLLCAAAVNEAKMIFDWRLSSVAVALMLFNWPATRVWSCACWTVRVSGNEGVPRPISPTVGEGVGVLARVAVAGLPFDEAASGVPG